MCPWQRRHGTQNLEFNLGMQPTGGNSYVAHQLYRTAIQQEYAARAKTEPQKAARPQKPLQPKPLTVLSCYLEKHPVCCSNGKINVIEKDIEEIDILPSQFRGIHTLFLSNNRISDLAGLAQFSRLRTLSLAYNDIADIGQVEYLSALTDLRTLRLEGNSICKLGNYRTKVIAAASSTLLTLDGKDITPMEREEAAQLVMDSVTTTAILRKNDPLSKITQRFSPKSLREKLRAAQSEQNDQPKDTESTTYKLESTVRTRNLPLSNASLVRDMTLLTGEQPSTILKSLTETERDDKDVFDYHGDTTPLSMEFLPSNMNLRTFTDLSEMGSINANHRATIDTGTPSQQREVKRDSRPVSAGGKRGSVSSLRQNSSMSRLRDVYTESMKQQANESHDTSLLVHKQQAVDPDNTAIVASRAGKMLHPNNSLSTQSLYPDSYSVSSPQELQKIVAEQAKELSLLRAKYGDYSALSHGTSLGAELQQKAQSSGLNSGELSAVIKKKQLAHLEHLGTIFRRIFKRDAFYTLRRKIKEQTRLREIEERVTNDYNHHLLSKCLTLISKIATSCYAGALLETRIIPKRRLQQIFTAWKEHTLGVCARKSQYATQRDLRQAINHYEVQLLERTAFAALYEESQRRNIERSRRYARWVERHGSPQMRDTSCRGIFKLWHTRLLTLHETEYDLQDLTERRIMKRALTLWARAAWQEGRVQMMIICRERASLRSVFNVLINKHLHVKEGRILFHIIGEKYNSVIRRKAFHQWRSLVSHLPSHTFMDKLADMCYHEREHAKAATLMRRCFCLWRYSSNDAQAIRGTAMYIEANKRLVCLVFGALRTELFQCVRNTLTSVQDDNVELTQAYVQKLKSKISVLSRELNTTIGTQHTLRDKVAQLETKCEDLLVVQQTQADEITSRDKRIAVLEDDLSKIRDADNLNAEIECTDIALLRVELKALSEKHNKLQLDYHNVVVQNRRLYSDIQAREQTIKEHMEANRLLRENLVRDQQLKSEIIARTAITEAQLLSTRAQLGALDQTAAMDRANQQSLVEQSLRVAETAKTEAQNLKEDIQYYKGLDFAQRTRIKSLEMQNEELTQRETRMQEQIMDLSYSTALPADLGVNVCAASKSLAIGDFSDTAGTVTATVKPIISYMRSDKEPAPPIKRPSIDVSNIDLEVEELQNRIADKFF